ncbi:FAD-dependent oxidoreductase [soil metagenome]
MAASRLALVGAGHAHLHLVRQADQLRGAGLLVTLIAPPRFQYSGLASGVLSGALEVEAAEIDVAALAADFGVRHLPQSVTAIDRGARTLSLAGGAVEPFDVLSLNIGSLASDPHGLVATTAVWPVKPLENLFTLRARLETGIAQGGPAPRIVVAGGGQSALEITASLCGLFENAQLRPDVTVIAPAFGAALPAAARARLLTSLFARGVHFRTGVVVGREPGAYRLADGAVGACDELVLATGLVGPPLIVDLALPLDDAGRLKVTMTLQSVEDPMIFAAGDCAVIADHPRPAAGVFGVRAAPVLLTNLAALGESRPFRTYQPQRRWLSIMDLGDGSGLAHRGRFWWLGSASLRLKRYLDLGFIRRMRAPLLTTGKRP